MSNTSQPEDNQKPKQRAKQVIQLDDLDWEDETIGGASGKLYFGEESDASSTPGLGFGLSGLDRPRPR